MNGKRKDFIPKERGNMTEVIEKEREWRGNVLRSLPMCVCVCVSGCESDHTSVCAHTCVGAKYGINHYAGSSYQERSIPCQVNTKEIFIQ